ncbi:ABC transporter substrate-binding protein [Synergistaceae bacterium OttesenSCG-928-D05]|nr:ABC transporter substrate-binding protein [Synergistaceae bacterium OttesenSCG-928-D05]
MEKCGKKSAVMEKIRQLLLAFLLIFFMNQSAYASPKVLFLDDFGRIVELPRPAVRIVSLSDAHAENLVAVRAVKQIIGVGDTADPKWIPKNVERLSRPPIIEKLKELKTDLVIVGALWASENSAFMSALSESELPFAVFATPEFSSFEEYLRRFGRLTGRTRDSEHAFSVMMKSLQKTGVRSEKTDDPKVLIIAGADYATCPKDSWASRIVEASGGVPLLKDGLLRTADSPLFVSYGQDEVSAIRDADVILTLTGTGRSVKDLSRDDILNNPRMWRMEAVKKGRVWEIDAATLMLPSLVRLEASLKECWTLIQRVPK